MKSQSTILTLAICSGLLFSAPTYAQNSCSSHIGDLQCGEVTVSSINRIGNTELLGTHVSGSTSVIGNFTAKNAELSTLNVTGEVNLTDSTVHGSVSLVGDTHINGTHIEGVFHLVGTLDSLETIYDNTVTSVGDINATHSTFNKDLDLNFSKAYFSSSTLRSIIIEINQGVNSAQELHLNHHTVVNGDIHFKSGHGSVYLASDSKINGEVIGGQLYYS